MLSIPFFTSRQTSQRLRLVSNGVCDAFYGLDDLGNSGQVFVPLQFVFDRRDSVIDKIQDLQFVSHTLNRGQDSFVLFDNRLKKFFQF